MMGIGDDHLSFKHAKPWIAPAVFAAAIASVDAIPRRGSIQGVRWWFLPRLRKCRLVWRRPD
jgi:hypothetical protein